MRANRLALIALIAAVLAGGGFGVYRWTVGRPPATVAEPPATVAEPPAIAEGERIYADNCAVCHGANLEGQENWRQRAPDGRLAAPPHDETGHTWHHPDQQLFDVTKYGVAAFAPDGYVSDMMAFEAVLTDDQIRAVLEYIKSTWPEDIQNRQARVSAQSQ